MRMTDLDIGRDEPFRHVRAPLGRWGERLVFVTVGVLAERLSDRMRSGRSRHERSLQPERDRAALHAELERIRQHLGDQRRNADHVLDSHERERRGIADRLHEEAAQAMSAALLAVGMLERGASGELTQSQLERVRSSIRDCITGLREIAASLRPASLEELGLLPALEHISELEQRRIARSVTFSAGGLTERLPAEVEAAAYRVIEEMLGVLHGVDPVNVSLAAQEGGLRIVVSGGHGAHLDAGAESLEARLATTRARLELIGGALRLGSMTDESELIAEIPLHHALRH